MSTITTRAAGLAGASIIAITIVAVGSNGATAREHQCQGRPATHVGTSGDDYISGTSGDDVIVGYGGDDFIVAGGGDDLICAGSGDDDVFAQAGNDRVYGEAGSDTILGYGGDDLILGGDGPDFLYGNTDSDVIYGGTGYDLINGGTGGTGPGDFCSDKSGAVIGADFYECEKYDLYLFVGPISNMPGLTIGG